MLLELTDTAKEQIINLLSKRQALGLRIKLKSKGCSGLAYHVEYADEIHPYDEVVELAEFKLFVDPKAIMFIIGTTIDFVQDELRSGFVFLNPNEKGKCGCGKSFHV